MISREISNTTISDALKYLHLLRSNLHAYNKRIAEVSPIPSLMQLNLRFMVLYLSFYILKIRFTAHM